MGFCELKDRTDDLQGEAAVNDTPFADAKGNAEGGFKRNTDGTISVFSIDAGKASESIGDKVKRRLLHNNLVQLFFTVQSVKEKRQTQLLGIIAFVLSFYGMSYLMVKAQYMTLPYKVSFSCDPLSLASLLFRGSALGVLFTGMICGIIAAFVIIQCKKKTSLLTDGRVIRSKNGTYGTSDWLNNDKQQLERTFYVTSELDKPENIPIGIYKNKLYCMPYVPKHDQFKNQNIAVIGGSGSGKSFAAIEPFVLQRLAHGESFVVSDTKGDICRAHYNTALKWGYDVKVFNTVNFFASNAWNCLKDIVEANPTQVYNYVDIYATTIIKNSSSGKEERFWMEGEQDMLRSILHLVCKSRAFEGRRTFRTVIELINNDIDTIINYLNSDDPNSSAYIASASIRNNKSRDIVEKFRSGLASRLQIYRTPEVNAVLSYDDIDFSESVRRKTAIFLITDSDKETYDVITSLFVTMLYMKLIEISNSKQYGGRLKIPFWIIIDELCNMAAIQDLSRKISTNRSRRINFVLAIQSLSQLDNRYEGLAGNILANCGTTLFYGCNDDVTARYISERAGSFTQIVKSKTEERPTFFSRLFIPLHKHERVEERPKMLIEVSDADQMQSGTVIAFISGKRPFKGTAYGAPMHRIYRYKQEISLDELKPPWISEYRRDNPGIDLPEPIVYQPSSHEENPQGPQFEIREGDFAVHEENSFSDKNSGITKIFTEDQQDDDGAEPEVQENGETEERLETRRREHSNFISAIKGSCVESKEQEEADVDQRHPETIAPFQGLAEDSVGRDRDVKSIADMPRQNRSGRFTEELYGKGGTDDYDEIY